VSRFQFVADHRDTFELKQLCETIEINRSSFYAWDKAAPGRAERAAADAALAERIEVFHRADRTYGAPRITADLNDGANPEEKVNHKRVARVMQENNIAGVKLRRRVKTTISEPSDQKVPDLFKRDFTAPAPNLKYVGDITYLPLANAKNLYLLVTWNRMAGWIITDRHHDHELRGLAAREHRGEVACPGSARASRRVAHDLDQSGPCAAHHRRLRPWVGGVSAGL
jgi:hypothetical protein